MECATKMGLPEEGKEAFIPDRVRRKATGGSDKQMRADKWLKSEGGWHPLPKDHRLVRQQSQDMTERQEVVQLQNSFLFCRK